MACVPEAWLSQQIMLAITGELSACSALGPVLLACFECYKLAQFEPAAVVGVFETLEQGEGTDELWL